MIAPHLLCGALVLLSYTCTVSSNNNDCVDLDRNGICDNLEHKVGSGSVGFSVDGLPRAATVMVTPDVPEVGSPCRALLGCDGQVLSLSGSLTEEGFDLWSNGIALRAMRRARDMDYAGTLVLGGELFSLTLTPRASSEESKR
jgi:hypothetical protein